MRTVLQPLRSKYIPAIMMSGTAPIFYRIPVKTALLEAVTTASYPREETTVLRFIPCLPNQHRYCIDGMRSLDNRHYPTVPRSLQGSYKLNGVAPVDRCQTLFSRSLVWGCKNVGSPLIRFHVP